MLIKGKKEIVEEVLFQMEPFVRGICLTNANMNRIAAVIDSNAVP
jgi:hypothetical protein